MKTEPVERFYRLLYFSPRPEDDERVCVGVILKDGKHAYVEYDDRLEKAHCFAPDYTRESLMFVLRSIQDEAGKIATEGRLYEFSPQFSLSNPRAILRPIDEQVRDVLRDKYLLKPRASEHKRKEKGVERKIERFLKEKIHVPSSEIVRKATVDDVVGFGAAKELPKDLVPKPVSRALISQSEIYLIDGIDLHVNNQDLLVNRVNRVAHTFWQYKNLKQIFPNLRDKHMVRAAIIFDGKEEKVEPSLKWRADYAIHQFEKDADLTIKEGSAQQERLMRESLQRLLPGS
jgi:hypothetical protein